MPLPTHDDRASGPFDVVCLCHLRWDFVWQRPQHLMSRCAQERRVLFVEQPRRSGDRATMHVRREREVVVATPVIPPDVDAAALDDVRADLLHGLLVDQGVRRFVLWHYDALDLPHTLGLAPLARVYDCMDQAGSFADAPPGAVEAEDELFRHVDLVFTGGRSLYEDKRDRHPAVHLFPSSVDRAHFERARDRLPEPADQADLPRPRLGWFGVIEERVDLELLGAVARARPDWQIVMVGPVIRSAEHALPEAPNLHFLGLRPYEALPAYLGGWDVAIMPFARNEATRFISPTKTLEYLAGGLGVVSTPVRDVVEPYGTAGAVEIADGPEAFVAAVERVLGGDAAARTAAAERLLEATSWDRTWAAMRGLLLDVVAAHAREARTDGSAGPAVPRRRERAGRRQRATVDPRAPRPAALARPQQITREERLP